MRPLAQSDGHDAPGLIDELVPSCTAMVDEIIVGFEDAVGEPIVAEELPDVFDRVELGAFRRQRNYGDVCRHHKTGRQVPAGLIDQEDGVGFGRDSFGDFRQVQVHGLGVAGRQDQGGALALVWADRAEDVGGSGALVTRRAGTGAALGPPSRDLVLLANARFVGEPDFNRLAVERFFSRDCLQTRGETFLKFSIAPSA